MRELGLNILVPNARAEDWCIGIIRLAIATDSFSGSVGNDMDVAMIVLGEHIDESKRWT